VRKSVTRLLAAFLLFLLPATAAGDNYTDAVTKAQRGEFRQAETLLKSLVDSGSCDPRVYHLLATCQARLGQSESALLTAEQGLGCEPNDELEKLHAWLIPLALPGLDAEIKLRSRLALRPGSPHYRKALAELIMRFDPAEVEAEKLLLEASEIAPEDMETLFLLGQWCCLNSRDEDCVTVLQRALELNQGNQQVSMQAYTMIALAEEARGRLELAREAFQKAAAANLRLAAPSPSTALQHVQFLMRHEYAAEARQELRALLEWAPQFAPALLEQAKSMAAEGKPAEAVEVALRALESAGDDTRQQRAVRAFLAKTLFLLGRRDEAMPHREWILKHP
jgi:tetratricopeptide (TPR) repeat protein